MFPLNLVWFAFLTGISPWWWIALAIVILVVEVSTMTTYLLGPALAAATVGVALFIEPALSGTAQIVLLGVSALVYGVLAYFLTRVLRQPGEGADDHLNRRNSALIGREATVEDAFTGGIGRVTVDGIGWRARLAQGARDSAPAPGSLARITAVDGAMLVVEPITAP